MIRMKKRLNVLKRSTKKLSQSCNARYLHTGSKGKDSSYAFTFGDNTFIFSKASKTFFQDRTNNLHIHIDNDTLHKLNSSIIISTNHSGLIFFYSGYFSIKTLARKL